MKREKVYKWPCWMNNKWSIDVDLTRWIIGVAFWWNSFDIGINTGPFEIIYFRRKK